MGPPTFTRSQDQPHRRTHALELAARKSLRPRRHRTLTAYLADVLDRIHDHKINKLDELLPWNWKAFLLEIGGQAA